MYLEEFGVKLIRFYKDPSFGKYGRWFESDYRGWERTG